jgi:uncharacterized protein (DUF488 family)
MNENLFTIGFTQKSAEMFFNTLKANSVQNLIDTRLNNSGQLAGFSKRDDLQYFCKTILSVNYFHWEDSAPTSEILDAYKKKLLPWDDYAKEYESLLIKRKIESQIDSVLGASPSCLLCSEAKPHNCHRSILAKYISQKCGQSINVKHLI